jgi:hypothetical protein
MKLMTTHEMAKRIGGLTLWSSQLSEDLGIEPTGSIFHPETGWGYDNAAFIELCDKLTARIAAAKAAALAKPDDDLDDL